MNYLKKILGELAMVLDQIEAELEKRKIEYQGRINHADSEFTSDLKNPTRVGQRPI